MNKTVESGMKFGRLTVLGFSHKYRRASYFNVQCECGTVKTVRKDSLYTGRAVSCGCYHKEAVSEATKTHGLRNTPEYEAWAHMLRRCYTPTTNGFEHYGGRGISVCDRWHHSFENFLSDMGFRPSRRHSLDRENNDGNYEPSNCRWATAEQQANNKRSNIYITLNGETLTETQWRKKLGFERGVISYRIKSGWSPEEALTTPVRTVRHSYK
jgi:hypothetical protein